MGKLSIAIDMGAKNNGVFICKIEDRQILDKKATCIAIDKNSINFSKKSRRENRHKDRNYKRRKLAKSVLKELVDFSKYDEKQQESILGLLNNRGYTFLSTEVEFEELSEVTFEFNKLYLKELSKYKTKDDFEEYFTNGFEDEKLLLKFLDNQVAHIQKLKDDLENFLKQKQIIVDLKSLQEKNILKKFKNFSYVKNLLYKYKYQNIGRNEKEIMPNLLNEEFDNSKIDFEKEFEYIEGLSFDKNALENKKTIQEDLKLVIDFFIGVKKEIETGSKPRKKYLKDIKDEIEKLDFIENKEQFYNLIGNISNLQLRVLRKFFNYNSSHKDRFEILKKYFKAHHYKKESEKKTKALLFKELEKYTSFEQFLKSCNPLYTIPPL